jgi:hypothetical protein
MFENLVRFFASSPLLLLFAVVALGYPISRIRIRCCQIWVRAHGNNWRSQIQFASMTIAPVAKTIQNSPRETSICGRRPVNTRASAEAKHDTAARQIKGLQRRRGEHL